MKRERCRQSVVARRRRHPGWRKLREQRGVEGLTSFNMGGSSSYLSASQEDVLKAWVGATLPRSTRPIGAFIEKELGLVMKAVRD